MPRFPAVESRTLDPATRALLGGSYIELSAGHTYFIDEGPKTAHPVVMLHGATLPSWCFDGMAERLVARGHRVLRFDAYGRGRTDRPDCRHDRQFFAQQLAEFLEAFAIERCHLVGFSLGAAVAAEFCAGHPDMVDRLVLMAPLLRYAKNPRLIRLACARRVGPLISATIGMKQVVARAELLFGTLGRAAAHRSALAEQISIRGFQESMRSIMRHCILADHESAFRGLGRSQIPTLVLWGDQDLETRRVHMEQILAWHRQAELQVFRGLGHGLAMQGVRRCSAAVCDFLGAAKAADSGRHVGQATVAA